jgi:glucose-6-phosphate 1-dehydrogenase
VSRQAAPRVLPATEVIARLILFGATGDLAGRFLLPALAALHAAGRLPIGLSVIGAATQEWDDAAFRRFADEQFREHAPEIAADSRAAVARSLRYRQVDVADAKSVAQVLRPDGTRADDEPLVAYLALPQGIFGTAVSALAEAGLPGASRIALEKPFGEDLDSAVELNALLADVSGLAGERAVFRVDHVLGMGTMQNLLTLRMADRVLDAVWSSEHIEEVQILWEETLALEGRAGFYDRAGALKDVVQNHMLQILALVAMERPASLNERDLRDSKVDALRTVRSPAPGVEQRMRRARYTAGRLSGTGGAEDRTVPSYVDEDGVDPDRGTETFAEVILELDNPRWAGTRFRLRAGKALARRHKGLVVRFRPAGGQVLAADTTAPADELTIGLDGPEEIGLRLTGAGGGVERCLAPIELRSAPYEDELPAYARVLLDVLSGGSGLSVRGDEAEEAWRIMTPVLEAFRNGRVPMEEYTAGSSGPAPLDATGGDERAG